MKIMDIAKISPIYFQMLAHWIYILFSIEISPNRHGVAYLLLSYVIFSIAYFFIKKKVNFNFTLLSVLVVINSTYLNFQYPPAYPLIMLGVFALAVFIKYYFRDIYSKSSLINPSIAAIAIITFIFPTLGSYSARFWSGDWYHILTIIFIGVIVTYKASTIVISLSYLVMHILFAITLDKSTSFLELDYFLQRPSMAINLGLLSFGSLLYTFHVISDPQSGPRTFKAQLFFGGGIGILDVLFKYLDVIQSAIVSYLIVTLIWIWFKSFRMRQQIQ
jgi:hypothetical protein